MPTLFERFQRETMKIKYEIPPVQGEVICKFSYDSQTQKFQMTNDETRRETQPDPSHQKTSYLKSSYMLRIDSLLNSTRAPSE